MRLFSGVRSQPGSTWPTMKETGSQRHERGRDLIPKHPGNQGNELVCRRVFMVLG